MHALSIGAGVLPWRELGTRTRMAFDAWRVSVTAGAGVTMPIMSSSGGPSRSGGVGKADAAGPTDDPPPPAAEPQSQSQSPNRVASSSAGSGAGTRSADDGPVPVRLEAPSVGAVVRGVLILTACVLLLYLLWRVRVVVRLVAISLFLALALIPIIDALATKIRVPRALIILIVYVVLIASVARHRVRGRPELGQGGRAAVARRAALRGRSAPERNVPALRQPLPHQRQTGRRCASAAAAAGASGRPAQGRHRSGGELHRTGGHGPGAWVHASPARSRIREPGTFA